MTTAIAKPRSRKAIRMLTQNLRELCGVQKYFEFPIVEFFEGVLPNILSDFNYEIIPDKEMGNCDGKTFPELSLIQIKESVYMGACEGKPRDRFTIAHEIGHLLLHGQNNVSHARIDDPNKKIKPYENPEWQANVFAAELLIPIEQINGLSAKEVADKCKVSFTAAEIQLNYVQ